MNSHLLSLGRFYIQSYRGLSATCWRGLTMSLMESICMSTFYFLSVYFVSDLHLDVAKAGMVISAYGFGAIAGGYLGGKLADKFSPLRVMSLSMLTQAICYLALIKLRSIPSLSVDVAVLGMASYAFLTANYLWVLEQCRREVERLKALNMLSTFSNFGFGVTGLLIGIVAQFGFRFIFLVVGLLLALLACYVEIVENKKGEALLHRSENISSDEDSRERKKTNYIVMGMALISVLFVGSVVSQLSSGYPIYINEIYNGMGMSALSILFMLNAFIVVFFATPIGQFVNKYNKFIMLGLSSFLIGFGMCMLSFSSLFGFVMFACIVYTVGEIIYFSLIQLFCYEAGAKKSKGKSLGRYRVVYGVSRVLGPYVGTTIYHHYSGEMLWYMCGLIGISCMLGFFSLKNLQEGMLINTAN